MVTSHYIVKHDVDDNGGVHAVQEGCEYLYMYTLLAPWIGWLKKEDGGSFFAVLRFLDLQYGCGLLSFWLLVQRSRGFRASSPRGRRRFEG